ncbi:RNA polymerase sigma factor [Patescibacteria group bacterium]|nr:RNA polymerase sigma factor [Patescibacteria group bacterium]MBU2219628.1 RNA polymerase sigma factor [Patescibacteria group bacterium]
MPQITEQQFLELYDANVGKIYRYIYFRVGSEEQAQDLTSEVFLKSWQYLQVKNEKSRLRQGFGGQVKVKSLDNPRAFFYQIARNLITDFYRQKNKSPISLDEIADKAITDKADSPSDLAAVALDMDTVKKALLCLNDDYREIIIWRYLDELEIREIADILEKREGAVRTLLSRALDSLKGVLGSNHQN